MSTIGFTEDHEWVRLEGDIATCGITEYAQDQLGDVVFVELPEVGRTLVKGDEAAVVESVKAAAEVYAPLGGEVTEANDVIVELPATVNEDAMGQGWFYRMRVADASELDGLMDQAGYQSYLEGLE